VISLAVVVSDYFFIAECFEHFFLAIAVLAFFLHFFIAIAESELDEAEAGATTAALPPMANTAVSNAVALRVLIDDIE